MPTAIKILAVLAIFPLALAVDASGIKAADNAARALERIIVEGVPECLNTGETAETQVRFIGESDPFEIAISTEHAANSGAEDGALSVTPERWSSGKGPVTIRLDGEKFGRERLIIRAVDRPDIAPVTAYIRIMPKIEEATDLSHGWTGKYATTVDDSGRTRIGREYLFTWQHRDAVEYYRFYLPLDETYMYGRSFRLPGGEDRFLVTLLPEDEFVWVLDGKAVNCEIEKWFVWGYQSLDLD